MASLISFLRGCYLPSLLRPMLPMVGGFAVFSDGYFFQTVSDGKAGFEINSSK